MEYLEGLKILAGMFSAAVILGFISKSGILGTPIEVKELDANINKCA